MNSTPNTEAADPVHAYLDGELSPLQAADVEARLIQDTSARILIKSLSVQRDALQDTYKLPLNCPKTQALIDRVLAA